MTNLDSIFKSRDITLPTNDHEAMQGIPNLKHSHIGSTTYLLTMRKLFNLSEALISSCLLRDLY